MVRTTYFSLELPTVMESPSTHESLLERLWHRDDPAAWQVFHERYGALIRDYGRRNGLQSSDCDDLLQDVLLSLTKALPKFRYDPERGSLRGYLKTVVLRTISKHRGQDRGHLRLEQIETPSAAADPSWDAAWRAHHIRRALSRLTGEFPERTLTAFHHYVLEERTPEETAELLAMSVDSVYQAKSRVLRRVSKLIHAQIREEG